MKKFSMYLTALVMLLVLSGCGAGALYTHTYQPVTLDMNHTRTSSTAAEGDIKHIQLNIISVAWDSAAIGDVAKKQGLKELYFADLETLKILGIWNQYTIHVYGK